MSRPASYIGGMYPLVGEPLYPELWRGCVFAAAPCLGPTGLTLRDWSGFGNHSTLTNMVPDEDWVVNTCGYALDFDGTNDYVDCGASVGRFALTQPFTASAWLATTNTANQYFIQSYGRNVVGFRGWFLGQASQKTYIQIQESPSVYRYRVGTTVLTDGKIRHLLITHDGSGVSTGLKIFVNGIEEVYSDTATLGSISTITSTENLFIGRRYNTPSDLYATFKGNSFGLWDRVLLPQEIKILARRPGISYELAPRRRSSILVPANITRYNLFTGSSAIQIIGGAS